VLEVTIDDGDDPDALRETGHAGSQAAHAAHDQVDLHARLTGEIKLLNDRGIDQAVHLREEPSRFAGAGVLGFFADVGEKVLAQPQRREQEVVEPLRPGVAGQKIEQLGQVPAKSFSASEKTEIAVYARSARVVISRRQMAVAPDAVGFLAHHQTHFAVGVVSTRP
jgi:hypothetical protein